MLRALILLLLSFPALAQTPDPKRAELDGMLDKLRSAPSAQASAALEARIEKAWAMQGGPAAALLLDRAARNAEHNASADALEDIAAALTLSPGYAEAFLRRAAIQASLGEYRAALADLEEVLKREPRQFEAFKELSRIAEARGDLAGALRAWEKALDIAPRTPYGPERLDELRKKLEDEGT